MLITLGFIQLNLADGSSWLVLYIILFIYFWLCESLLLHGPFSSCGEWRLHSSWGAWTSLCGGFLLHSRALGLWGFTSCDTGSGVTRLGLWGTGSIAVEQWLSCPQAVGSCRVRDWTHVPCTGRWILHHWATRETPNWLILNGLVFRKCAVLGLSCFNVANLLGPYSTWPLWVGGWKRKWKWFSLVWLFATPLEFSRPE